jgi:hypothetical protein
LDPAAAAAFAAFLPSALMRALSMASFALCARVVSVAATALAAAPMPAIWPARTFLASDALASVLYCRADAPRSRFVSATLSRAVLTLPCATAWPASFCVGATTCASVSA